MRRGVLAGVERLRNLSGGRPGVGDQGVGQGRFAHSGLANQETGLLRQMRQQESALVARAELDLSLIHI